MQLKSKYEARFGPAAGAVVRRRSRSPSPDRLPALGPIAREDPLAPNIGTFGALFSRVRFMPCRIDCRRWN